MKKFKTVNILLLLFVMVALTSCSGENALSISSFGLNNNKVFSAENFADEYANPETYIDKEVNFYGKIYKVENNEKGSRLDVYTSVDAKSNSVAVFSFDSSEFKEGDIVNIYGRMMEGLDIEDTMMPQVVALEVTNAKKDHSS